MGIDLHSLNFLRFCFNKHGNFGETITLGRHGLHVTEFMANDTFLRRIVAEAQNNNEYFIDETLKRRFGSSTVNALDYSDYQGASLLHDLNKPLPADTRTFDTVIDAGTTEHVYSVPTALANARELCRPGGMIIHVLPANNFCGHGFWQFSPELFWSLYSAKNGFTDTEIYLAKLDDRRRWYRLKALAHAGRANIFSDFRVHLLIKTVKAQRSESAFTIPQQVDYTELWNASKNEEEYQKRYPREEDGLGRLRRMVATNRALRSLRNELFRYRPPFSMRLNRYNPCLETVRISKAVMQ